MASGYDKTPDNDYNRGVGDRELTPIAILISLFVGAMLGYWLSLPNECSVVRVSQLDKETRNGIQYAMVPLNDLTGDGCLEISRHPSWE